MGVIDRDRGFKRLVKGLQAQNVPQALVVGVQGKEAAEPSKDNPELTVGAVATFNELGLGVPERSFLRDWADQHKEEIQEDLRKVQRAVLAGKMTAERGLQILGLKYVGQIQTRIANGIAPPNAESTIRQKGSSVPLMDRGQLRSAITFLLEDLRKEHS